MKANYEKYRQLTDKVVAGDREERHHYIASPDELLGDPEDSSVQAAFIRALVDELDTPEHH